MAQLKVYLARSNADIVLLQETWLDEKRKTPSFIGYAAYRKDRPIRKGGGLITLVKDNGYIHHRLADAAVTPTDQSTEILRVQIIFLGKYFHVTNLYSPPYLCRTPEGRVNGFNAMYTLGVCLNTGADNIIAGDFNAHSSY